jgi:hypothetical protein
MNTQRAGHFQFELPGAWARDIEAETSKVRGIPIDSAHLPPAPTAEQARALFWQSRLKKISEVAVDYDEPRLIKEDELRPNVPRVLYRGGAHELDRVVEVLLTDPSHAILLRTNWTNYGDAAEKTNVGPDARRRLEEVVAAHRFLSPGDSKADPAWFFLPNGAITLPYSASTRDAEENLGVLFKDPSKEIRFSLESTFPWQGRDSRKPSFLGRLTQVVGGWAFGMRSIRTGRRTVAGLKGEEALMRLKGDEDDPDELAFGWVYEPPAGSTGFRPKIAIELTSPATDVDEKVALWDLALDRIGLLVHD